MVDHNLRANWVTPVPITHVSGTREMLKQEVMTELNKRIEEGPSSLEEELFYRHIMLLLNDSQRMPSVPVSDALAWPIHFAPTVVSG